MQRMNLWIGMIMFISICLSVIVLLFGLGLYFLHHSHEIVNFQHFHGDPAYLISFKSIWQGALALNPESVIQLGLVSVVAGQVLRVFLTGIIFILERDAWFTLFTLLILLELLHGVF